MVEQRLGQRRTLGRIRAGAELVEQHQAAGSGGVDDAHDRAQVPAERGERLRDGLLVADVGEDVAEDRQAAAGRRRHVQPGLVHQRQQAEGPQRDGLAAGVRPGDDQRREVATEPDVDGYDLSRQARMPRAQQGQLLGRGRLGADAVELSRQAGLGGPEVEERQRVEGAAQSLRLRRDERRQLVEDALLLGLDPELRLAPGIAELDHDERLDEERLAAARLVVDDALDLAPGIGADRDHVAAVAERDDRFLERGADLAAVDERLEAGAQPLVRDPHRAAQAAQRRRGRVEQLPRRIEAQLQAVAQRGKRGDPARELVEQRALLLPERVCQAPGGDQRPQHVQQLGGIQPAAARRASDRRTDVRAPPMPTSERSERKLRAWSVSSRPRATTIGSFEGSSCSARRRDGPNPA